MRLYSFRSVIYVLIVLLVATLFTLINGFVTFTVAILTMLFLLLLAFSAFSRGLATRLFFSVLCMTHIIGLWTLHLFQDLFTVSGWTAVKQFDFSAEQYASIFLPVIVMYFLLIMLLCLLEILLPSSLRIPRFEFDIFTSSIMAQGTRRSNVVIGFIILLMLPVHDFMFQNMIAVTGQSHLQNPLPFKIGGFLFYFTKIFLPLILLSLYFKARTSLLLLTVLLGYGLFVGLTQMSRSTLFMLILPILLIHLSRKEYMLAFFSGIVLILGGMFLSFLRDVANEIAVFEIINGQSMTSLFVLVLPELSNFNFHYENLVNMANRFGGGQDVVLSSQYSLNATGGLLANLSRVFLGDQSFAGPSSWHLYDFVPTLGSGVGYGGITAQLVQVTRGSYLITLSIVLFLAICLKTYDYLLAKISTRSNNNSVGYILSLPMLLLFFLYSSFVLVLSYLIFLICLHTMMKIKIDFKKHRH